MQRMSIHICNKMSVLIIPGELLHHMREKIPFHHFCCSVIGLLCLAVVHTSPISSVIHSYTSLKEFNWDGVFLSLFVG